MHLKSLNTYFEDAALELSLGLVFPANTPVIDAVSEVLRLLNLDTRIANVTETRTNDASQASLKAAIDAAQSTAPETTTTRRRRTAAPVIGSSETVHVGPETVVDRTVDAPPAVEGTRRRRAAVAPTETAPPPPATISDADMSRHCSHAASIIGPDEVMAILKEFDCTSGSAVPQDKRRAFIAELAKDIEAEQLEQAAKKAGVTV